MGASEADMIDVMESAVSELDDVLGDRVSAMVISGSMIPPRRGVRTQEGPQFLTSRVLVSPMVRVLGYTRRDAHTSGDRAYTRTGNSDSPCESSAV